MTELAPTQQLFEKWNTALEAYCKHPTAESYLEQVNAWSTYIAALNALAEADKQKSIAESWPAGIDQEIFMPDFCDSGD